MGASGSPDLCSTLTVARFHLAGLGGVSGNGAADADGREGAKHTRLIQLVAGCGRAGAGGRGCIRMGADF